MAGLLSGDVMHNCWQEGLESWAGHTPAGGEFAVTAVPGTERASSTARAGCQASWQCDLGQVLVTSLALHCLLRKVQIMGPNSHVYWAGDMS